MQFGVPSAFDLALGPGSFGPGNTKSHGCSAASCRIRWLSKAWRTSEVPFPRFGNQPAWAVAVLLYLNALLFRNPAVEVVNLVICSSNIPRHVRAWRKAISKPIPDVGLHVVAEKGGSREREGFHQLRVVVCKLSSPTKGIWPPLFQLGR
jgi:hypothetical protein